MDKFNSTVEPPKQPYAMKVVGTGVIASCLLLCVLFAWGIYLDLQKQDCPNPIEVAVETGASAPE